MKRNLLKRTIALMLCMVMVLGTSTSALADEANTDNANAAGTIQETESGIAAHSEEETAPEDPAPVEEPVEQPAETPKEEPKAEEPKVEAPAETPEQKPETPAETPKQDEPKQEETVDGENGEVEEELKRTEPVYFERTVDGVKVIVTSKDEDVLPADAELYVAKIDQEKKLNKIKETIETEIAETEEVIKDMMAFDIKFMVNGNEVQPRGEVQVRFENIGFGTEENVSVYHVDTIQKEATDMNAVVENKEEVKFDTTHFSQYVIINTGEAEITVTIEHWVEENDGSEWKIYRDQTSAIEQYNDNEEKKLINVTAEDEDYTLKRVVQVLASGTESEVTFTQIGKEKVIDLNDIKEKNTEEILIKCYYESTIGNYENGTTFFDYDICGGVRTFKKNESYTLKLGTSYVDVYVYLGDGKFKKSWEENAYQLNEGEEFQIQGKHETQQQWGNGELLPCIWSGNDSCNCNGPGGGINSDENYPENSQTNNRIMMGQKTQTNLNYTYFVKAKNSSGTETDCNINYKDSDHPIMPGLIEKLEGSQYSDVKFLPDEPGFFSKDARKGKKILDEYKLNFSRNGNKYTLSEVIDPHNNVVVDNVNYFWPLNGEESLDPHWTAENGYGPANWFFGMRYDFEFSLGDYVGDMKYTFTGDDDLWVFLDGRRILDLGGIHAKYPDSNGSGKIDAYPNEANLWKELWENLGGEASASEDDIKKELTDEQRKETHTITVLYMERGGIGSNCSMEFVIPNAKPVAPIITAKPKANLSFAKKAVNENNTAGASLEGASFGLYAADDLTFSNMLAESTSNSMGTVSFESLSPGTYIMKEIASPNGYILSNKIWKVVVTLSDDKTKAEAKLLNEDNTPVENNIIFNYEYKKELKQSKTANLSDDTTRTYEIDLNASYEVSYQVNTPEDLKDLLETQTKANIIDDIDPRFDLLDTNGNVIKFNDNGKPIDDNGDPITDNTLFYGGTVQKKGNIVSIRWDDTLIGNSANNQGWNKLIKVKAKPDFIGGNNIPTNGEHSGISTTGDDTPEIHFDEPAVHVRLLSLAGSDLTTTFFYGDQIEPALLIEQLFGNEKIVGLGENEAYPIPDNVKLTATEIANFIVTTGSQAPRKAYTYPGTPDSVGEFVYGITAVDHGFGTDYKPHETPNPNGPKVEKAEEYVLTITYTPFSQEVREGKVAARPSFDPETHGDSTCGKILDPGKDILPCIMHHYVNIISGQIEITKKLLAPATGKKDERIFQFKVLKKEGDKYEWYPHVQYPYEIEIPVGEKVGVIDNEQLSGDAKLNNLKRGIYVVEEIGIPKGYKLVDVGVNNKTNCRYETKEDPTTKLNTYTFYIGTKGGVNVGADSGKDAAEEPILDPPSLASIVFTNQKKIADEWYIRKCSSSGSYESPVPLKGAEFALINNLIGDGLDIDTTTIGATVSKEETENPPHPYYGLSDENGKVKWYDEIENGVPVEPEVTQFPAGTYTLTETKAPAGFQLSNATWTVVIDSTGALVSITPNADLHFEGPSENPIVCLYIENTPVYDLPSAGGSGIYWYMIGGMLLMLAAALILYKSLRREVLRS